MIVTLGTCKSCYMGYEAITLKLCNELNINIKYIYRQIYMISMELLRKFDVKIMNMHKIHIFTCFALQRTTAYKYPGCIRDYIKNSCGYFTGRLARG